MLKICQIAQKFEPETVKDDKLLLWKIVMKLSDVCNPTKQWTLSYRWCQLVLQEFINQGDMVPVSPFMDRDNMNIPSSQLGFIDYVIVPLFEAYDKLYEIPHIVENLRKNRDQW